MKYIKEDIVGNIITRETFEADTIDDVIKLKEAIDESSKNNITSIKVDVNVSDNARAKTFEEFLKSKCLRTIGYLDI